VYASVILFLLSKFVQITCDNCNLFSFSGSAPRTLLGCGCGSRRGW